MNKICCLLVAIIVLGGCAKQKDGPSSNTPGYSDKTVHIAYQVTGLHDVTLKTPQDSVVWQRMLVSVWCDDSVDWSLLPSILPAGVTISPASDVRKTKYGSPFYSDMLFTVSINTPGTYPVGVIFHTHNLFYDYVDTYRYNITVIP